MAHWKRVCPLPGWLWGARKGDPRCQGKVALSKSGTEVPTLSPLLSGSYILFSLGLVFPGASFLYLTTVLLQPSLSRQAFQPLPTGSSLLPSLKTNKWK